MFDATRRSSPARSSLAALRGARRPRLQAQGVKVTDPTSVVMIVNRDSNDIAFMDIKTRKMIGRTSSSATT